MERISGKLEVEMAAEFGTRENGHNPRLNPWGRPEIIFENNLADINAGDRPTSSYRVNVGQLGRVKHKVCKG